MTRATHDEALLAMRILVLALEGGSLAAAARALRLSPSSASKRLAQLEASVGVPLLRRTTRALAPTPAGERYAARAARVLADVDLAAQEARGEHAQIRGLLRVSAPTLLGQELLAPRLARFLQSHEGMNVELVLSDDFVDLVSARIDVALRVAPAMRSSELVARRVGVQEHVLVASPAALSAHGPVLTPQNLDGYPAIELAHWSDHGRWSLTHRGKSHLVRPRTVLTINHFGAVLRAAVGGAGVAVVPAYLAESEIARGTLVRVLPGSTLRRRVVHVVHAGGRETSAKTRAFVGFVVAELGPALRARG